MNKKQVQQRVLKDGKPLALSKFTWCEKTRTFSSDVDGLVLDFKGVNNCTFNTSSGCIFNTGWGCIFNTGSDCAFNTGSDCVFNTGSGCTFNTGSGCIFKTGWGCIFKTGQHCTFKTSSGCIFNTAHRCTFNTGSDCIFKTGRLCVIVRRDVFEVIQPNKGDIIQLCPYDIKGYLVNGLKDGEPHIIADGILSRVVKDNYALSEIIKLTQGQFGHETFKDFIG